MKFFQLLVGMVLIFCSCNSLQSVTAENKEDSIESVNELRNYIKNNCRFDGFSIGKYNDTNSYEKFGLDTLKGKYIWYTNQNEKIIINTFLKEKFAAKYTYYQINKAFPKLKGAFTITVKSKETEKNMLADFKKNDIKSEILVSFNDELGYSSEIEVSKCYSRKAESVLTNYPEVKVTYN